MLQLVLVPCHRFVLNIRVHATQNVTKVLDIARALEGGNGVVH